VNLVAPKAVEIVGNGVVIEAFDAGAGWRGTHSSPRSYCLTRIPARAAAAACFVSSEAGS
jgi:hypothetical protein